ncbi:hypothetical protein MMC26_001900 [Xylographa opegraphella]|nr:hypothetical protein [Xylographa opegraphella]
MDGASNVLAFLGLADIVLRAGSKIYDFITAIQDAPQEIRDLQHELNGVTLLLSELKNHCNDFSLVRSQSCSSSLINCCLSSLRIVHQDLDILVIAANKHDSSKKVASTWAKIKWAFADKRIVKLTRSLERHKLFLVAALAVDGKCMQLCHQQELTQSILQSSNQILSSIAGRSKQYEQEIKDLRILFLSNQTTLELEAPNILSRNAADTGFQSNRQILRAPTRPRRKLPTRISLQSRKLDAIHVDVKHLSIMLGRLDAAPNPISHARSLGENREEILLSLLLLRPQIKSAMESLSAVKRHGISKTRLGWLGSEFSRLFTTVMQGNDDMTTYDRIVPTATQTNTVYHTSSFYGGCFFTKAASKRIAKHHGGPGHKETLVRIWRFESTSGRLDIRRTMTSSDQTIGRVEELGFTFMPFLDMPASTPAARAGRLDVLKYLSDQGFGPAVIDAGSHALRGLCELWRNQAYNPSRSNKRRDDMFRWLIESGCDVNYSMPLSEGPVQYTLMDQSMFFFPESVSLFQQWITMLRKEQYNLETRNFAGETTLLTHAGIPGFYSVKAIQWLLKSGADTKATNPQGFNSLVCAMLSTGNTCERFRFIIGSKLRRLISGGCDIYQRDLMGLTPSQHAVKNSCWYEWCFALEYNGLNPHKVIAESKGRQKLSFLELSKNCFKDDWPIDDLSPLQSQMARSPDLFAIVSYNRWKRTHVVVYLYFLTSVKTMHSISSSDYRPLLDLCNDSNFAAGFHKAEDYGAIYESLRKLFLNRKDLFDILYALTRTLPRNVWDEPGFYRIVDQGHARAEDSIDEVIVVLQLAKIFYYRFYMKNIMS